MNMPNIEVNAKSIYVHIPFCGFICSYCDFCKVYYGRSLAAHYIIKLREEFRSLNYEGVFDTIYIGGGTPSILIPSQLKFVLKMFEGHIGPNTEFTVECNPETTNEEKLEIMHKYGVNRISLGVQTTDKFMLNNVLNRFHLFLDVKQVIKKARKIGFQNINVDLMYALPHTDLEYLNRDIQRFINLNVEHISTYCLTVQDHTMMHNLGLEDMNEDIQREMYDFISKELCNNGFIRYEVSNFAKPGYESKHNLVYWNNKQYYGIGTGAAGFLGNVRFSHEKTATKYIQNSGHIEEEIVDHKSNINYFLMLNLRKKEGFLIDDLKGICSKDEFGQILEAINKQVQENLLFMTDDRIYVNEKEMFILDFILRDLFI